MKDDMIYAPVLIPTLCRYEHFVRCIESLKRNTWAKHTDIYIGLDYPAKDEHWVGYKKICAYLEGDFSEFNKFCVIKRKENFGGARNMRELRIKILAEYDRFIRSDDDAEFSPNFLEYMDKCLMQFEDDSEIVAVTGYSYPITWKVSDKSNALKINCICPMWGTAFWRESFNKIHYDMKHNFFKKKFREVLCDGTINDLTKARYIDYVNAVLNLNETSLMNCFSDIAVSTYLVLAEKAIVCPTVSKVRNHGFDGSGIYCQRISKESMGDFAENYDYFNQVIDIDKNFELIMDQYNDYKMNKNILDKFDRRSKWKLLKAKTKIILYKILGEKKFFRVLAVNKRLKMHKKNLRYILNKSRD